MYIFKPCGLYVLLEDSCSVTEINFENPEQKVDSFEDSLFVVCVVADLQEETFFSDCLSIKDFHYAPSKRQKSLT